MESKIPVRFIRCTEADIQKMNSKSSEEIEINLNLEKEPEEDPVEKLINEFEKIKGTN